MRNLTKKQIQEIKYITFYSPTNFHGNTKKIGTLNKKDYLDIVEKKWVRHQKRFDFSIEKPIQLTKRLIKKSLESKGTTYFKIMIEGNKNIYYASPVYMHNDYNKNILFAKNEQTLKLMHLFNKIVNK
jgi:hypothetical protein